MYVVVKDCIQKLLQQNPLISEGKDILNNGFLFWLIFGLLIATAVFDLHFDGFLLFAMKRYERFNNLSSLTLQLSSN